MNVVSFFIAIGGGAGYTTTMQSQHWYRWIPWIGFILALAIRLWQLGIPAELVSDEVFFVQDGQSYVTHQTYFDPHPPLGKLEIGTALKFFGYQPIAWRIATALQGALIVPVLWWIVWRLTRKRVAANIAMCLVLLDGLLLVDSRLGLINIPYVLMSLAAFATMLKGLDSHHFRRWLFASGTLLGLALATKWLAVLVGVPMILVWLWPKFFGQPERSRNTNYWLTTFLCLIVWPMIVYWLVFVWHFAWLGLPFTFFDTNIQMLNYHLRVPAIGDQYSQPWWGWLFASQPFPYWTQVHEAKNSVLFSLPNPWIWWSGALIFLFSLYRGWHDKVTRLVNILLLFAWIPFGFIQRVMYSYHALLFDMWLIILVAIFLSRLWEGHKKAVVTYLLITGIVFVWFAPWYLNIPLSAEQHKLRRWLPTWGVGL